jgi:hypothetical protein
MGETLDICKGYQGTVLMDMFHKYCLRLLFSVPIPAKVFFSQNSASDYFLGKKPSPPSG